MVRGMLHLSSFARKDVRFLPRGSRTSGMLLRLAPAFAHENFGLAVNDEEVAMNPITRRLLLVLATSTISGT